MTAFNHKAFYDAVRPLFGGKLKQQQVDALNAAIAIGFGLGTEPAWLIEARKDIGLKEMPGVANAPRIINMLKLVRYPFSDDSTPWCGTAMAAWMTQAGVPPPPQGYRAASWKTWGQPCTAQVGAVGVKARQGGNHVFLIVGITPDGRRYKALGGNQSDMVTIMDVAVGDVDAIRWPAGVPIGNIPLPVMAAGTISRNEA